ncbi:MAG TPA: hypothetical protein VF785_21710, partial [Gemmatimonadaceae bacterium]
WLISDAVTRNASAIADKLGHRRIAAILEAEARVNNDADKLWDCAQHWLAAGEVPRAIEMLTQCAQYAMEIGRLREAAGLLVKAASLASHPVRHELACRAIRLAHEISELDVVLRAAELVDRTDRADVHDEIEIAELLAQGIAPGEESDAQARLHHCVLASNADESHRINAARALLVFADSAGGAGLSQDGFGALADLIQLKDRADDPDCLKLLVLYHATVGEAAKLGTLSRQLRDVGHRERPEIAANLFHYAAAGFWRGGEPTEALTTFTRAFEAAESVGLRRLQFLAASMLSSFSHDIGDEKGSRDWMEKAEKIADELPALRTNMSYVAICFENALIRSDVVELKRLLDVSARVGLASGPRRMIRALEVSIQRLSGEPLDREAVVSELIRHHVPARESGNLSDLEVAIATDVLDRDQDAGLARSTVLNYLQEYRRGLAPIAAMLRDAIRRLAIDVKALPSWCQIYGTELPR